MKSILFLAAVHGDEGFSIPLLQELEKEFSDFSWLIANEEALKHGVRFLDVDLNRSAPGDPSSNCYEMRRASELLKIARQYRFVIDIHGATANSGIFAIVANPTPRNLALAASLPVSNVVFWVAKSSEQLGPITQFVNCGVGIECGPKDSKEVLEELRQILITVMKQGIALNPDHQQNWFRVYGRVPKEKAETAQNMRDFEQANLGGETFYPLLVGQYEDTHCYKMERLNFWDIFAC